MSLFASRDTQSHNARAWAIACRAWSHALKGCSGFASIMDIQMFSAGSSSSPNCDVSKASRGINLSEKFFAVGKVRDVGLNQISLFEAKVACFNGVQILSRDIYHLGLRFDMFCKLPSYFTTVDFYVSSMALFITKWIGEFTSREFTSKVYTFKAALASQSLIQIGLLMALPMVMEIGIGRGFRTALSDIIIMQLQLCSVFFTFSLGTKTHYFGRTVMHGGANTGPLVVVWLYGMRSLHKITGFTQGAIL
ncbi:hypothetical protein EJ110_NYTH11293 [Nymphaea thermarum]|nr:hypothetical protein EJ110_NYTH11293 [Nymphaea thermarum]